MWLKRVSKDGHGTQEEEAVSKNARAEELVMMGLRLAEGLDKERFEHLAGQPLDGCVDSAAKTRLIEDGYLAETPYELSATAKGRLALNAVLRDLLA